MKNQKLFKAGLLLSICCVTALGFMMAKAAEHEAIKLVKECTMMDMQKCTMSCTMSCDKSIKDLSDAMSLLDKATNDVDANNMIDAKAKIERVKMMLKNMQDEQKKCFSKMPTCNAKCPISGESIDMMNTPENLTRVCNGKKIGFCSSGCLSQWDKLSDKKKQTKIDKVMPEMTKEKEQIEKMHDDMDIRDEEDDMM